MKCKGARVADVGFIPCTSIKPALLMPGFYELHVDQHICRVVNGNSIIEVEELEAEPSPLTVQATPID